MSQEPAQRPSLLHDLLMLAIQIASIALGVVVIFSFVFAADAYDLRFRGPGTSLLRHLRTGRRGRSSHLTYGRPLTV